MFKILFLTIFSIVLYADRYYYHGDNKIYLTFVENQTRDLNAISSKLQNKNGTYLYIDNTLIVKLKVDIDIQSFIEQYDLIHIKQLYKNTHLLQINNNEDIFDISNKLHLDRRTIFSHPNFLKDIKKR